MKMQKNGELYTFVLTEVSFKDSLSMLPIFVRVFSNFCNKASMLLVMSGGDMRLDFDRRSSDLVH